MWRGLLLTMVLAVLVSPVAGQDSNRRDIEGKLLALERVGKLQATQLKDLKMLNEILDENFVVVDQDGGLMNKAQLLAFVQMATSLQYLTSDMTVRLHGNTAIVTGTYRLNGTLAGRRIDRRSRFVDTWLEKEGKWVVIASLSTPLT
ncbi:MAG TPA: nuclear transport factor 2 family protein [Candidatus Sulfotelmatobacter sp.]|nr:nuclear transport factor 2 family protein [Candidatus Sulfotelmatobacter sp.]